MSLFRPFADFYVDSLVDTISLWSPDLLEGVAYGPNPGQSWDDLRSDWKGTIGYFLAWGGYGSRGSFLSTEHATELNGWVPLWHIRNATGNSAARGEDLLGSYYGFSIWRWPVSGSSSSDITGLDFRIFFDID